MEVKDTSEGVVFIMSESIDIDFLASVVNSANITAQKAAEIFDSPDVSVQRAVEILSNSIISVSKAASIFNYLSPDKAASILNDSNFTSDRAASIFNDSNLSVDKAAAILNSSNLSADKAASILSSSNLSADKAASILDNSALSESKTYDIVNGITDTARKASILNEIIKTKTPYLEGTWDTKPSDLGNIVDMDVDTCTTEGVVSAEGNESNDGCIIVDLGKKYPIASIYVKWSGTGSAVSGSGCNYGYNNYLECSVDKSTWSEIAQGLTFDDTVNVNADVRYFRFRSNAHTETSGGICSANVKIQVYHLEVKG